jgi:hypothetical protein
MHILIKDEKNNRINKYYPPPAIIEGEYQYEDINKNPELRKNMTRFFYNKVLKWIEKDNQYNKLKSIKSLIEKHGKVYIYNILRRFVKKSGLNWYDLKDEYKYIKKYLCKKLLNIKK